MKSIFTIVVLFFGFAVQEVSEEYKGKVIGITDGDTIKILVDKKQVTIRLEGIDAPEQNQDYGTKSKQALSDFVFGKEVVVKKTGLDKYQRILGVVLVDGVDVNSKMVEDGWAWHFKKYSDDEGLAALEKEARAAKRGLWQDPNPMSPWDLRERQKTKPKGVAVKYWLNSSSNIRHNHNCKFYNNTKSGRECSATEGKACKICGG